MRAMRQVSSLEKLTSGRYLVSLDDGSSFPLYGKELDAFGITLDGALEDKAYEVIMGELLPKRARQKAMHLLEVMDRTEQQLRQKLEGCGYPPEIVDQAVEYVRSYHYIDDVRYAESYIEFRKSSRSVMKLRQELYQKGISGEDFEEALSHIEAPDEAQQIRAWAEKKKFRPEEADRRETERFFQFLLRKGYSSSAILRVLRSTEWDENGFQHLQ